ncbi:MAG: hypothetical protein ACW96U_00935 [Candidatus Heimdallarchaeaceae archaeon]|jgi:hypothetical protein
MTLDLNIKMRNLNGEEIEQPGTFNGKCLELRDVLVQIVITEADGSEVSSSQKIERYDMAIKMKNGGSIDFSENEIKMIEDGMKEQKLPILIEGQIDKILKGKPTGLESGKK